MSSCHLLLGRPLDLFPLLGCHSVHRLVHLLSFNLAIWPAHFHFCFSVYSMISMIFVLFLISAHGILSFSFRSNIFLSIASSLMGFWPTINALARRVVDGFFIWGVLPVVFWLTGLTHKDRGGWGYKGASYPPDSSFIGFLRYFMEVAAPPACSASPSAAVASWSATTYLPTPYS